jgi:protein-S-isoprenylcysteine O-methyltransferase Ste14
MNLLPGLHSLVDKVPELGTPRGFLRALLSFGVPLGFALLVFTQLDVRWPFLALVWQLLLYGTAYFLAADFFSPRPGLPYAEAFFNRLLPAGGLIWASLLYVMMNNGAPTPGGFEPAARLIPQIVGIPLALYLGLTGVAMIITAARAAGVDTLAGAYMYYPDEGRRITSSLYGIVRHPVYGGMARLALAFALANSTAFGLLLGVAFVFAWEPRWIGLEERELVRRFGDEYRDTMQRLPAVFPAFPEGELDLLRALLRRP